MKAICQLYMPAFYRSYGEHAIKQITDLLEDLKTVGFEGIYLIALWQDGGFDNGFDVVEYSVNLGFGTEEEFRELIRKAHELGLLVGADIVPHHVSDRNILARNCLNDIPGYRECLTVVSRNEAISLTKAGVPSFFGKLAYSPFGDKYVRTTFADYHQLDLNWRSRRVQEYFDSVFRRLKKNGIDFLRVDCGGMLLEDVTRADPKNPMACMNPLESIEAVRRVSDGMLLFYEWFDPSTAYLFNDKPNNYALDCSYVIGKQNFEWNQRKLIPLLGGHDQMTAADRGIDIVETLRKMQKSEYAFLDIQTLISWKTISKILPGDSDYDADLTNPNQRYRARRPIDPVVRRFRTLVEKTYE